MEIRTSIKENWLTKEPTREGLSPTLYLMSLLLLASFIYLNDLFNAQGWMSASGEKVFHTNQWWRLWSTIFAHGDLTHILSNLFLFFPFSYFLIGYFGPYFFPLVGFFIGGLINLIVIQTMPEHIGLIGVSGVVYWMGGAWITLSWMIDRREDLTRRLVKAGGVSLILFVPESFKPEISYLSHFLGYFFGVISAVIYYHFNKEKFLASEVSEQICEDDSYVWGVDYAHELDQDINDASKNYVLVPLYQKHEHKK
jgi:rhomboid protease GluP